MKSDRGESGDDCRFVFLAVRFVDFLFILAGIRADVVLIWVSFSGLW